MRVALLVMMTGCLGSISGTGDRRESGVDAAVQPDAVPVDVMRRALEAWSGCMTPENFQAAGMAEAWGAMAGTDRRLCRNCHSDGAFGFVATLDDGVFFAAISQRVSLLTKYFHYDAAAMAVVVSTASMESVARRPGHPSFDALNNPGLTALRAFHASTAANPACGAPRLID